jgi:hypothetical protein
MLARGISVALTLVKALKKKLAMHLRSGQLQGWPVNTTLSARLIGRDCQSRGRGPG